jgi:putative DNA primase/helicase
MSGHYSGGTASLDVYLKGFAGSAIRVDRQGAAQHIDNPTLSICLAVQPEAFGELASSKRLRVTGLLARFLYAIPKSNIGARDVRARKTVPNAVRDTYRGRILDLLDGYLIRGDGPRVLTFEADALEAWLAFSEGVEASQGEGGRYEAISDWTGKLPGQAARMAALFQIADVGLMADRVTLVNVQRALDLARLLVRHAEAAFALLGADDADADALAVLRWIQAGRFQQFTRREAQRAMHGRFTKVERLERALSILFDRYIISGERKAMTGGRASAFYLVNPKLYPERRPA